MTLDEAAKEFEFDCEIRHLSPKTIDNYGKQLRYLQRFLEKEFSISMIEDVKPSHIKQFLSMMDDAGRKPQYVASAFNGWQAVKIGSQVGWVSGKYSEIKTE